MSEEISLWEFNDGLHCPLCYIYIYGVVTGEHFRCTYSFGFELDTELGTTPFRKDYFVEMVFQKTTKQMKVSQSKYICI